MPAPRILIVDDANLVRTYYRDALQRAGYAVEEALNGLEALERLLSATADSHPVGLLIVDINMPRMDGITFVRTLRAQAWPLAATPVLVTSTEARPADWDAARAAGANFYLVKPVPQDRLVRYAALLCGAPA